MRGCLTTASIYMLNQNIIRANSAIEEDKKIIEEKMKKTVVTIQKKTMSFEELRDDIFYPYIE